MLNDWFTYNYAKGLRAVENAIFDGSLPVLIRLGDDLITLHGQQRQTQAILSDRYHALKSVCHLPLALYMDLKEFCNKKLPPQNLQRLRALERELATFEADETAMQSVLDTTRALIDELNSGRPLTEQRLIDYERNTRDAVSRCIYLAAQDELFRLHACVSRFTEVFTASQWQSLRVIICASHQSRYRESTRQYFKTLLQEHQGIEEQVLYAENCASEQDAMQLLATHLLDRELAEFFLGSPLDLQQDVLGDAAQRVISKIFSHSDAVAK